MAVDPSMNVLMIHDSASMLRMGRALLGQIGYVNIDEARDGAEALKILRSKSFDLVFADWTGNPVTGAEFLRSAGDYGA